MSNLTNENFINLNLSSNSRDEAIIELAKLINADGRLKSYDDYIAEVFIRESSSSTGIGFGIAIPHGKCDTVTTATLAFGRNDKGIEWDSLDGEPVRIVFLLAVPRSGEGSNEHLRLIAAIARKLMDEEFTNKLHNSNSPKEILSLLLSVI
ncbi:MAG: PTS sugar transporter subunit IIA [Clostridiaceae bacterium]|nr:PTS sugar transporter subunit IIA [Clostridiaceae bacterium]